jgi:hypothetical protein
LAIIYANDVAAKRSGRRVPVAEEWKNLYQGAILETDWSRIEGRIQVAESAIRARLHEFFTQSRRNA